MIIVTDSSGNGHVFNGDCDFHTEDMTNNLVVESDTRYAVFAEGKWISAEKVRDGE